MRRPSRRVPRRHPILALAVLRTVGPPSARPEVERLESRVLPASNPTLPPVIPITTPIPVAWNPPPAAPGGPVEGSASAQTATAGVASDFTPLASFTVPGSLLDAGPFQANVTWGDGTMNDQATPESLGPGGPAISIVGPIYGATGADPNATYTLKFDDSHTFAHPGTYTFTVTFLSGYEGPPLATATGTVTVGAGGGGQGTNPTPPIIIVPPPTGGSVQGTAHDQTATAGVSTGSVPLATFTGADALLNDFNATIDWGDGSHVDQGAPDLGGSEETFYGSHTYAAPGTYTFTVTYFSGGVAQDTVTGTVTVSPASGPLVQGHGIDQSATAGVPTSFLPLATFSAPSAAMTDFSERSTVDWGDGSTSPGLPTMNLTTQDGQTTDRIAGRHVYTQPGTYTYTVTYTLDYSITATATGTITVAPGDGPAASGQGNDQATTTGTSDHFYPLATFTLPTSAFQDSSFLLQVDWGDGTGPGFVSDITWDTQGAQTVVTVGAQHTFANPGTYTYQVSYITDGVTLATASGTVTVTGQGQGGGTGVGGPIPPTFNPTPPIIIESIAVIDPGGPPPPAGPVAVPTVVTSPPQAPANPPAAAAVAATPTIPALPLVIRLELEFELILDELWAGLYTTPGSGSTIPAAEEASQATTTPADPLNFDVQYWDASLGLLAT
jgi:hypothetical protein